ncbi:MAG: ATP-binding protein [Thermodesulforhabdaceae bacterium]
MKVGEFFGTLPLIKNPPESLLMTTIAISSIILAAMGIYSSHSLVFTVILMGLLCINLVGLYKILKSFQKLKESQVRINDQLIQSHKLSALGEIVTGIAHEINNPLAIIHQEVQWVQHCMSSQEENLIEEVKDSVQEISRQVQRCRDITHKLLDFARKRKPVAQSADLNEVIEDMVKLVELTTKTPTKNRELGNLGNTKAEKFIRIERNYNLNIPLVLVDVPLLRQVILNLLVNAVQSLGEQGGIIEVSTRYSGGDMVEFSVSDTGCGIPPEHLDKIFIPFFTTKPPGQGTGLGLSLAYTIIHSMGGTIEVESKLGKGSRFTVQLPARKKEGQSHGGKTTFATQSFDS